jgi:hypothetical protein
MGRGLGTPPDFVGYGSGVADDVRRLWELGIGLGTPPDVVGYAGEGAFSCGPERVIRGRV